MKKARHREVPGFCAFKAAEKTQGLLAVGNGQAA